MNKICKGCKSRVKNKCDGKNESFKYCLYSCDPLEMFYSLQFNNIDELKNKAISQLRLFKIDTLEIKKHLIGVDILVGECIYGYYAPAGYVIYSTND